MRCLRWPRLAVVTVAFIALWSLALGTVVAMLGWRSPLAQMGWFFTKAALLTFGGAYAVLPYVYQGAVETFGWLTAAQMIDGLALGETTPGPLIMVVAFVGFVGGWTKQILGPDMLALGGIVAASVVTFFTFLPSFLFILVGRSDHRNDARPTSLYGAADRDHGRRRRRHRESRHVLRLARVLAGWLASRRSCVGGVDLAALAIGVVAAVALLRYKAGVIPVILACAAAGWLLSAVR